MSRTLDKDVSFVSLIKIGPKDIFVVLPISFSYFTHASSCFLVKFIHLLPTISSVGVSVKLASVALARSMLKQSPLELNPVFLIPCLEFHYWVNHFPVGLFWS